MTKTEAAVIREAILWLDEHAQHMSRDVIDGYRGIQDGLVSLLPSDPRLPACECCGEPVGEGGALCPACQVSR
jgi:hypothetical protein